MTDDGSWMTWLLGLGGAAGAAALSKQVLSASAIESRLETVETKVEGHDAKLDTISNNIATLVERTTRADEDRKEILAILRTPRG